MRENELIRNLISKLDEAAMPNIDISSERFVRISGAAIKNVSKNYRRYLLKDGNDISKELTFKFDVNVQNKRFEILVITGKRIPNNIRNEIEEKFLIELKNRFQIDFTKSRAVQTNDKSILIYDRIDTDMFTGFGFYER